MKKLLLLIFVLCSLFTKAQFQPFVGGNFTFGSNPGYYGAQFTDEQLYDLMRAAGPRSTRSFVPVQYWRQFGLGTFTARLQHAYVNDSMRNNTFFLDVSPYAGTYTGQSTKVTAGGNRSWLPAGLNLNPFNVDSSINAANVWAVYVDSVVRTYGAWFDIYEVWNEPDFSFTADAYEDSTQDPTSWQKREPSPDDLPNVYDSLENYVRLQQVAYWVVKHAKPTAKVATGGLGYSWFYMWALRKGIGPYVDLLCFHEYPFYQWTACQWNGTNCNGTPGNTGQHRNSDFAVSRVDSAAAMFQTIETQESAPLKQLMTTESMIPRWSYPANVSVTPFPNNKQFGSNDVQINFTLKNLTKMAKKYAFYMYYIYETGEGETFKVTTSNNVFNAMGLDTNLVNSTPTTNGLSPLGQATLGAYNILKGYKLAGSQPVMPAGVDGALWNNGTTNIYTIWAITTLDTVETATGNFTLPTGNYNKFSNLGVAQGAVTGGNQVLTGDYTYFVQTSGVPPVPPTAVPTANLTTVRLPLDSVNLIGTGSHANPSGTITAYLWQQVSGPSTATLRTPNASTSEAVMTVAGTYVFSLKVTDGNSLTNTVNITITVQAALTNPISNAGANQTITLPTSTVNLSGTGTDPNAGGSITAYLWTQLAGGPVTATITTPTSATTGITGLTVAGTYQFQLRVTDNFALQGVSTVTITVNPAVLPITVSAGPAQTITLPTTTATMAGSFTDPNVGAVATATWTKTSGPAVGTITNIHSLTTTITGLTSPGVYVFQLTVTDNKGGTGNSAVVITINNATHTNPVAVITGPTVVNYPFFSSVTLVGTGSHDTNIGGSITNYLWARVSGPNVPNIVSPINSSTLITGLIPGNYTFSLKVTDNFGMTNTATYVVHVTRRWWAINHQKKYVKNR